MKKIITFLIAISTATISFAQEVEQVEMADTMRANGKIYVVVAILCVIFAGIVLYLYRIEKKVTRLEKEKQ